jgi:hypothetical protein
MAQRLARAIAAAFAQVGVQEVLFVAGVGSLACGLSLVWMPAAFIIPGSILTAVAVFGVR